MKIIEFFATFTLKKAIKAIKIMIFWLKHYILSKIVYYTTDLWKKTIFEKITLPSQNIRYLGSGKSVLCLIPQGCDMYRHFRIFDISFFMHHGEPPSSPP